MGTQNSKIDITLISYNCDLFCYNFIRYNELLKFIKNIDNNYVICLQGINDEKSFNKLLLDLKSIQTYNKIIPSVFNNKNFEYIKKSGLCIISSIKVEDYYYRNIRFDSSLNNFFNNSGYIKCKLILDDYKFNIINININKTNNIIKNEQINKNLIKLINEIIKNHETNNIYYITGNFNILVKNNNSLKIINLFEDYKNNIINLVNSYNNILLFLDKRFYNIKYLNSQISKKNINIRIRTDICISEYYPIQITIK